MTAGSDDTSTIVLVYVSKALERMRPGEEVVLDISKDEQEMFVEGKSFQVVCSNTSCLFWIHAKNKHSTKHTRHAVIIGPDRYTRVMMASPSFYLAGKHSFEALNKRPDKVLTHHPMRLFSAGSSRLRIPAGFSISKL